MMGIFNKIKEVLRRLFSRDSIKNKIDVDIAVSEEMSLAIDTWTKIYKDKPPWKYDRNGKEVVKTMNLPAIISSELARLATSELETHISDKKLDAYYQMVIADLRQCCELGCATGGIVFKPSIENDKIAVTYVQAESFFPTNYDAFGEITGAIFLDQIIKGKIIYTKVEEHELENNQYSIRNYAFENKADNIDDSNDIGKQIPLSNVSEWEDLEEEWMCGGILSPLFGYFKMPGVNLVDGKSPLGVSCFSKAIDLIKQADLQYDRTIWEYEGSELAIDIDSTWLIQDGITGKLELPKSGERLFRKLNMNDQTNAYNVFAPNIRDSSLFNGLNNLLKRIEFNCGLSYGTISDPSNVDKTATEIISSKQRLYSTVKDVQGALEDALNQLVYAMSVWCKIGGISPNIGQKVSFNWDDSIIIDKQIELATMQQDVSSGILKPEIYIAKKYGVTEEEALKMMPEKIETQSDPFNNLI
ncbi:MAG: phage portal protein [Eubacterium sp.]